ncbi:unnamed protein product [Clavelina lepadiformis]|uniref:Fibrinogen C-terminal domain-containing protein n=1 Tax=Clavelina lepadiformis TaxID=159417 RepID=A0ABP0FPH0_CLALP
MSAKRNPEENICEEYFFVNEANPASSQPKANNDEKHVMISYNWESQKLAKKIYEKLEKRGYKVWIDIKCMNKNIYDRMDEAVRNAYVVLIFVSKKYQESENCKREASTAGDLKIPIVPIYTEKDLEPEQFLKLLTAGKLRHYFTNDKNFDSNFDELCSKSIESHQKKQGQDKALGISPKVKQSHDSRRQEERHYCSKHRKQIFLLVFLLLLAIVGAGVGGYFGFIGTSSGGDNQLIPNSTTVVSSVRQNSCQDHYTSGSDTSGVYTIYPISDPIQVYCDQVRDGGGWTVIQRRFDGSENFNRSWVDYTEGFGSASGEHWLGLDLISAMTSGGGQEIRIDFVRRHLSEPGSMKCSLFVVGDLSFRFAVTGIDTCSTLTTGISLDFIQLLWGQQFSTFDVDHDRESTKNCAESEEGGWWYDECSSASSRANLNGAYHRDFKIASINLISSEMKIRPRTEADI